MNLFTHFKKKSAIKSYVKELPRLLLKDFGRSKKYKPKQVVSAAESGGLSIVYVCHAIAMFSSRRDFDHYHQEKGEACDYDAMRSEVGNSYFHGSMDYSVSALFSLSSEMGGGADTGYSGSDDSISHD